MGLTESNHSLLLGLTNVTSGYLPTKPHISNGPYGNWGTMDVPYLTSLVFIYYFCQSVNRCYLLVFAHWLQVVQYQPLLHFNSQRKHRVSSDNERFYVSPATVTSLTCTSNITQTPQQCKIPSDTIWSSLCRISMHASMVQRFSTSPSNSLQQTAVLFPLF